MKVSTNFEVDTTIRCLVIAADTLHDLVTSVVSHVINPSTKFEDPTAIRS